MQIDYTHISTDGAEVMIYSNGDAEITFPRFDLPGGCVRANIHLEYNGTAHIQAFDINTPHFVPLTEADRAIIHNAALHAI